MSGLGPYGRRRDRGEGPASVATGARQTQGCFVYLPNCFALTAGAATDVASEAGGVVVVTVTPVCIPPADTKSGPEVCCGPLVTANAPMATTALHPITADTSLTRLR